MQTGCVGALSQLIYTIRGHDEEPAFPGLNDKRVAVVCVSDASAYGPDTLTYGEASLGSDLVFGFHNGPAKQQTNHFGKADLGPLAQYDH